MMMMMMMTIWLGLVVIVGLERDASLWKGNWLEWQVGHRGGFRGGGRVHQWWKRLVGIRYKSCWYWWWICARAMFSRR